MRNSNKSKVKTYKRFYRAFAVFYIIEEGLVFFFIGIAFIGVKHE